MSVDIMCLGFEASSGWTVVMDEHGQKKPVKFWNLSGTFQHVTILQWHKRDKFHWNLLLLLFQH